MSLGDYLQEFLLVLAPALMLAGSIIAWRKKRRFSAILQIVGSACFLLWGVYMIAATMGVAWGIIDLHFFRSPRGSWVRYISFYCLWTAGICFPVGFFWHALRASRYI